MKWIEVCALVLFVSAGFSTLAGAEVTYWKADLNAAEEVPPNASPGLGGAYFELDDGSNELLFNISYENLMGTTTGAHIHRGGIGVNGPVVYLLSGGPFDTNFGGTIDFNMADLPDLVDGQLYVNFHTTLYPDGEIRAQIHQIPTPNEQSTWGRVKALYR